MSKLVGAIVFKTAHMDMLLITTNDRSTRFWGKLGEGFFSWKGNRVHGYILNFVF